MDEDAKDRVRGALWGALLGDAAGVTLEFFGKPITEKDIDMALRYPGGGAFRVGPGQVSDDGEMTLSLWNALVEVQRPEELADAAAAAYRAWFRSKPFDMGHTTRNAVSDSGESAASMQARSAQLNPLSMSNGSLMRCSPMVAAALRWNWNGPTLAKYVRAEAALTHSHVGVQWAQVAYVTAMVHLCRRRGDVPGALKAVQRVIKKSESPDLAEWWRRSQNPAPLTDAGKNIGWMRHGWILAFQHLRLGSDWTTAMRATLRCGGDTDTNACIVGAMIGALHGFAALPADAVATVRKAPGPRHHVRPTRLQPRMLPI